MTSHALAPAQNTNVPTVRDSIMGMYSALERSAAEQVEMTLREGGVLDEYTEIEKRALVRVEMLRQSNALDYASVVVKAAVLDEIEGESLFAIHPGGYETLSDMAKDVGISTSELSQIKDMVEIIFPYLQEEMELDTMAVWQEVGKSNLREITPLLKRIITGEEARDSVERQYDFIMDEIYATASAAGQDRPDEDDAHQLAVEMLLEDAERLSNADLRQRTRPDRTPSVNAVVIRAGNRNVLVAELDDAQEQMIARRLHGHWDPIFLDRSDAENHVELRRIARLLDGEAT